MIIQLTNATSDWQVGQIGQTFEAVYLTAEGGRPFFVVDIARLGLPAQYGFVPFDDAAVIDPGTAPPPASPSYHAQIMVDAWIDQEMIAEVDASRMVTEVATAIELDRLYAVRSVEMRDVHAGIQGLADRLELVADRVEAQRYALDQMHAAIGTTFGDGR